MLTSQDMRRIRGSGESGFTHVGIIPRTDLFHSKNKQTLVENFSSLTLLIIEQLFYRWN